MNTPSKGLKPPALLRRVNDSVSPARVEVRVQPGDEVQVSEDVAEQLGSEFKDPEVVPEAAPQVVYDENGEVDYDASDKAALKAAGLAPPEKPKKATAKKATAKKAT